MSFLKKLVVAILGSGLVACSGAPRLITEYRIDVQQGNVLSQEMVTQLRPGLSMDQVRYVLGSPVLTDVFHANRWDYVYRLQRGLESQPILRRFSVFFNEAGVLDHVEGDLDVATKADLEVAPNRVQLIELGSLPEGAEAPKASYVEKGWWSRTKETLGF
ncbi:MAG: hypothetical protein RIR18_2190 [Pseudomonadota bacterium]|jgi:outer membrane protein assembly factor BamE